MSTYKTRIEQKLVKEFVKENFTTDAHSFKSIADGEASQGFFFSSKSDEYVIRVNKKIYSFEKDKYAYENFQSEKIPIPETLSIGKLNNDLFFSITKRARGKLLSDLSKEEILKAIPSIIKILDSIHAIDISYTTGFGCFDAKGKTDLKSFSHHLEKLITRMPESYKKEVGNKLLEKNVVDKLLEKYKKLLKYSPDVRYLVHADFGFNNATVENNKITGIFDWEHAFYGDFLYDIAWLDFWGNKAIEKDRIDYKGIFYKHYQEKDVDIINYNERILLYKLNFGIGAMMFFVHSHQEKKYLDTKTHLLELIKDL